MTSKLYWTALGVRLLMIAYGEWQDSHFAVKYTDVDYRVFTDAASYVASGGSPYDRATYRYTPLLAWAMVPNIWVHNGFGKVIFALIDIAIGKLIQYFLETRKVGKHALNMALWSWLFNPITINVSTRGNAEAMVSVLVLAVVALLLKQKTKTAAILFGLSVHFKIYPVVYAGALFLFLCDGYEPSRAKGKRSILQCVLRPSQSAVVFAALSLMTFFILNAVMYWLYGMKFLDQTYLYHLRRTDAKHNFSLYFYHMYLEGAESSHSVLSTATFLPQIVLIGVLTVKLYRHIELCIFVQTLAFVIFNKVCTVQYFVWYLALLPLALPGITLSWRRAAMLASLWIGGQGLWLGMAYLLEFGGHNVFLWVWLAGIIFFLGNSMMLIEIMNHYRGQPVFHQGVVMPIDSKVHGE